MRDNKRDNIYCYPDSNVLVNKLGITDKDELFQAEIQFTSARLYQLQEKPINGKFGFTHLKKIHQYIFQDLYEWAGKVRKVNIGKGNLFCLVQNIPSYAETIFNTYYSSCYAAKDNKEEFLGQLVKNYANLNALHPFREGNGRSQREYARELCLKCGYVFDLSNTSHKEMLNASIISFNEGDNAELLRIFTTAVIPIDEYKGRPDDFLSILSSDDLETQEIIESYEYYEPQYKFCQSK